MHFDRHLADPHIRTIRSMIDAGYTVTIRCTGCHHHVHLDLYALEGRTNPDYSLINRRCRCRITSNCDGWNRFYYNAPGEIAAHPLYQAVQWDRWQERDEKS